MVKDRGAWHPAVRGSQRVRYLEIQRLTNLQRPLLPVHCAERSACFGVSPGKMRSLPDPGRKFYLLASMGPLEIMGALDGKPIVLGRKCFTKLLMGARGQLQLFTSKPVTGPLCTGGDLFSSGSFQILKSWTDICFKISLVLPNCVSSGSQKELLKYLLIFVVFISEVFISLWEPKSFML